MRSPTARAVGRLHDAFNDLTNAYLAGQLAVHERVDDAHFRLDEVYLVAGAPLLVREVIGAPAPTFTSLPHMDRASWLCLREASRSHKAAMPLQELGMADLAEPPAGI